MQIKQVMHSIINSESSMALRPLLRYLDRLARCISLAGIACVTAAGAAPLWDSRRIALESIGLDGCLALELPLGSLGRTDGFDMLLQLRHSVAQCPGSHARSIWEVPQLSAYLLPGRPNYLRCLAMGGLMFEFRIPSHTGVFEEISNPHWLVRSNADGSIDLLNMLGVCYRYKNGGLELIYFGSGNFFTVRSKGAKITEIFRGSPVSGERLLTATYTPDGLPHKLLIRGVEHTFTYDANALLVSCSSLRQAYRFAYRLLLVEAVCRDGNSDLSFKWGEATKPKPGYPGHPTVALLSDAAFHYSRYEHPADGIVLRKTDAFGESEEKAYNFARRHSRLARPYLRTNAGNDAKYTSWRDYDPNLVFPFSATTGKY